MYNKVAKQENKEQNILSVFSFISLRKFKLRIICIYYTIYYKNIF